MKRTFYEASVIFEAGIQPGDGFSYLTIYGKHVNGYFCCLPSFSIGCEMAEPDDIFYNKARLIEAGLSVDQANNVARAICEIANQKGGNK